MKKNHARLVLVGLLIAASITSYAYLQTVAPKVESAETESVENRTFESAEENRNEISLPDIRLLEKLLETGKRLIPTS